MALASRTKRSLLFGFIVPVALCGLVGIYCLISGRMGWLEERILLSTGALGGASVLALGSAVPWERRRWHPIGLVGVIAVAIAFAMLITFIWSHQVQRATLFTSALGIACVFGVALPLAGLLSLARLKRSYEWVRAATLVAVALLAGEICTLILEIDLPVRSDRLWRILGILGICVGCGAIAVPILHRISAIRKREAVRTFELAIELTCPRCNRAQQLAVGRSRCSGCGLRFSIMIEEEHCRKCGYPLYMLESAACPECGTPIVRTGGEA